MGNQTRISTFQSAVTYGAGDGASSVVLGDLNGDGILDMATANRNSDDATVLLGNSREGVNPMLPFSLKSAADALQALAPLDRKLETLNQQRGFIGAFQSRLEVANNVLKVSTENFKAAEGRIRDADISTEAATLVRTQILQQSSAVVLAQANLQPSLAIKLLQ